MTNTFVDHVMTDNTHPFPLRDLPTSVRTKGSAPDPGSSS